MRSEADLYGYDEPEMTAVERAAYGYDDAPAVLDLPATQMVEVDAPGPDVITLPVVKVYAPPLEIVRTQEEEDELLLQGLALVMAKTVADATERRP